MNKYKFLKRFITFLAILTLSLLGGCTDDRASSVTGPHATASNDFYTFKIQADKTNMSLNNTLSFSLTATRTDNSVFVGKNTWPFSYTSNDKIDANSGSTTVSLDAGESASSLTVTFSGIKASVRGTAIITGTFAGAISVSTEVVID